MDRLERIIQVENVRGVVESRGKVLLRILRETVSPQKREVTRDKQAQ